MQFPQCQIFAFEWEDHTPVQCYFRVKFGAVSNLATSIAYAKFFYLIIWLMLSFSNYFILKSLLLQVQKFYDKK